MNIKKILISVLAFSLTSSLLMASPRKGSLIGVKAGYSAPVGFYKDLLNPGMGLGLFGLYFSGWKYLFWQGEIGYDNYEFTPNLDSQMSSFSLTGGPFLYVNLHKFFQPFIGFQGGASFFTLNMKGTEETSNTFKPIGLVKTGILMSPLRAVSLQLEGSYRVSQISGNIFQNYAISFSTMLSTDFSGGAGTRLGRKESLVQITDVKLNPIFGARYGSYKEKGIGRVTVENIGRNSLFEVYIEAEINEITDQPTSTKKIKIIEPNNKIELDIPIAISKKILEVQEDRDLPISLKVIYKTRRGIFSYVEHETILVHPKNSITWDNTLHLGNFITPMENSVSSFTREAISEFNKVRITGIPKKMQQAMYLFDTLGTYGISYVTDPNMGFKSAHSKKTSIDYVMFPRETLKKKAGDCDDLTTLYAALLESVGIKTALVTIPGHIFLMFDTEVPGNSHKDITEDKSLIHIRGGTVWIPVEVTMIGKNFIDAWKNGAKHVKRYKGNRRDFEIIETEDAWIKFPPADLGSGESFDIPDADKIKSLYAVDLDALKTFGFYNIIKKYTARAEKNPNDYKALNKLGIVYAKTGKLDKALEQFNKALSFNKRFSPALVNMGNVSLIKQDYKKAAAYFEKAMTLKPNNHRLQISLARAYYETGKKFQAKEQYERAIKKYPGYRTRYAYLQGGSNARAADPEERREFNLWGYE